MSAAAWCLSEMQVHWPLSCANYWATKQNGIVCGNELTDSDGRWSGRKWQVATLRLFSGLYKSMVSWQCVHAFGVLRWNN